MTGAFVSETNVVFAKGDILKQSLIRHGPDSLAHAIIELI